MAEAELFLNPRFGGAVIIAMDLGPFQKGTLGLHFFKLIDRHKVILTAVYLTGAELACRVRN